MVLTLDSLETLGTEMIPKKIIKESVIEPYTLQSDDNISVEKIKVCLRNEKDTQLLSNTSSYVKQEQFSSSCIRGKKPCASSLSDVKTFTNSKKRQFTATNTIRLPQRKLPLGAIPSYMKNIKGYSNTVIAKKETHTKLKLKIISDSSFQDSMTKINKFNLKNESLSNILDQDETSASKIQLNSGDCVKIAVRNFLLELREGKQILFNDSDIMQFTDKINHIFEKKAVLLGYNISEVHSKMSSENEIMLKKNNNQFKKTNQLQVSNKDLVKHRSKEIKILEKKLQLCRKKIKAQKFTIIANEYNLNKNNNFIKKESTIDNNKVKFDCLMKIVEKLKIELHTLFGTVETDLRNLEEENPFLKVFDRKRTNLEVSNGKDVCLKLNNKSLFDERTMSEIIKSNSERNEIDDLQATLAQLSQKYTILKSKMENEKHKSATQINLLDLRGDIIKNMQDNDSYHKMRIISLLKDIEIEKTKSKEFIKMKAAHQEELNNLFSTVTKTQRCNTHLEAELLKLTIGTQAQKKSVRK